MTAQTPRSPECAAHTSAGDAAGVLLDALADRVAGRVAGLLADREAGAAEPWLGVEQAAEHLACPASRIYDLVSEGRVRCARDGRRLLFRREWLDQAVDGAE